MSNNQYELINKKAIRGDCIKVIKGVGTNSTGLGCWNLINFYYNCQKVRLIMVY